MARLPTPRCRLPRRLPVRDSLAKSEHLQHRRIEQVTTVRGDITDLGLLERVLGEYQVDVVFHIAAQAIVGTANRDPVSTFTTNIQGTWNLLEACRRSSQVSSIVVASSDKAYGDQERLPYTEEMPLLGRHPYDVSKACGDMIARPTPLATTCLSQSRVAEISMAAAI